MSFSSCVQLLTLGSLNVRFLHSGIFSRLYLIFLAFVRIFSNQLVLVGFFFLFLQGLIFLEIVPEWMLVVQALVTM